MDGISCIFVCWPGELNQHSQWAARGAPAHWPPGSFRRVTLVTLRHFAPDERVTSVAPGWVDTELNDPVFGDTVYKRTVADNIPLRRIATADDVACSIVFLASDLARHITGEVLNVNGGAVLCG